MDYAFDQVSDLGMLASPPLSGPASNDVCQFAHLRGRASEIFRDTFMDIGSEKTYRQAHRPSGSVSETPVDRIAEESIRHGLTELTITRLLAGVIPSKTTQGYIFRVGRVGSQEIGW